MEIRTGLKCTKYSGAKVELAAWIDITIYVNRNQATNRSKHPAQLGEGRCDAVRDNNTAVIATWRIY
jgi:hypothetical protein